MTENSHHCCITSPLAAQKFAWINQSEEEKPVLWKMNILSSGEMSIPEKLASHNEQLQGGQEHRAISLNILPEDAAKRGGKTVVEVRRRADTLKAELAEQYGTAGKAFIARFLSQQNDDGSLMSYSELSEQIKATTEECCQILSRTAIRRICSFRYSAPGVKTLCTLSGCRGDGS